MSLFRCQMPSAVLPRARCAEQCVSCAVWDGTRTVEGGSAAMCDQRPEGPWSGIPEVPFEGYARVGAGVFCKSCGEQAPYGDERQYWLLWHENWVHRLFWRARRR